MEDILLKPKKNYAPKKPLQKHNTSTGLNLNRRISTGTIGKNQNNSQENKEKAEK